jgi:small subunit ribosomal protein S15
MYLTKEIKEEIFAQHERENKHRKTEGQIALFTFRITHLTEHLKKNRHDYNTERSLVLLVGKRRSLLDYLKKKEINRYRDQSIGYQKIINILKRRESAFCFIPTLKGQN